MTVLGKVVRSVEDPRIPLSEPALVEWLNQNERTLAGVSMNEQRAFGLTAYLRAITLMAGTASILPLNVYRKGEQRDKVTAKTVLDSPNSAQTPFEFWQTMYANAFGWGNAYAMKVRNGADVVKEVWPVHPSRVKVEVVDPSPEYPAGKVFQVTQKNGNPRPFSDWEVFHLPYLALDGRIGLSPLRACRQSLAVGAAAEEYSARFYGSGSHQSGFLKTQKKLDEDHANRLKARWKSKMAGLANSHEIAILDDGAEFQSISINPEDAQLLESRKFGVVEIARMFGIPPHLLGDVERSTSWGTGIEQQTIGFVVYTMQPWLTMVEQRATRELLPGGWSSGMWGCEYDLRGLMRGDSAARAAYYASGIQWGWLQRGEPRDFEGLPYVEGLDDFVIPSNMTLVQVNGQMVPLAASTTTGDPNGNEDAPAA